MGGGLMQLVAYGAQDIYLTGDPQITFFKVVYRRHTNFALEAIQQTFNGVVDFGRKVTATVSRNGDLIHKMYLQVDLPALASATTTAWTRNIGHTLIKSIEFQIGGQKIDKHYGEWLQIWSELTQTAEHEDGYSVMIGNTSTLTTLAGSIPAQRLYIPLQFWFNRNPGLALPLIALQYHEVKIDIEFRPASECYIGSPSTTPALVDASLYVDYVYLDTDERRQFAQVAHEYLIEQLQFTGAESFSNSSVKSKLNFNHPVKSIHWVVQLDSNVESGENRHSDFTDNGTGPNDYAGNDPLTDAKLLLNGHDRFSVRNAAYFNLVQPYQHYTRIPSVGIYSYSFALKPEEHQPSGTVNMSRIDNATLQLTNATGANAVKLRVYAVNYNILRVMSGMGGVAYSN
jgi:hypothetical protein